MDTDATRTGTGGPQYENAPNRDSVLTDDELADYLRISVDKVRSADLPTIYFGRDRRYLLGQVLDFLAAKAA